MNHRQQQAAYEQQQAQAAAYYAAQMQQQQQNPAAGHSKYKSTVCNVWIMEGVCPRGRMCNYAHGIRELNYSQYYQFWGQQQPTASPIPQPPAAAMMMKPEEYHNRYYKTAICQFWQSKGICNNGDQCRWAHGEHELRRPDQSNGYDGGQMEGQEGDTETSKVMIGPQLEGPLASSPSATGAEQQYPANYGNELTPMQPPMDNSNSQGSSEENAQNEEQQEKEGTTSRKRTHDQAGLGEDGAGDEDGPPQQKQ